MTEEHENSGSGTIDIPLQRHAAQRSPFLRLLLAPAKQPDPAAALPDAAANDASAQQSEHPGGGATASAAAAKLHIAAPAAQPVA